jgi:hypothetical protein
MHECTNDIMLVLNEYYEEPKEEGYDIPQVVA